MEESLLDTDIYSEIRRARNVRVGEQARAYLAAYSRYAISTVTVVEVVRGYRQTHREQNIVAFLHDLTEFDVLTLDIEAAELAGRIQGDLKRAGSPIGWADPLIAAIALRHDRTLVTGNTAHYAYIQALGYPLRLDN